MCNCFIAQGETFEVPEVVPFRLSHNMVHALVSVNVKEHIVHYLCVYG